MIDSKAIPFIVGGAVAGGVLKGPLGVAVGFGIGWALSSLLQGDSSATPSLEIKGLAFMPGRGSEALELITNPSGVSGPIATLSPFQQPATVWHA